MNVAQIILIILWSLGIGIELVSHGKPRTGKHNVLTQIFNVAVNVLLLWWGDFGADRSKT